MRSQRLLLLGAAVGAGLTLLALVGVLLGWWWLVVLAAMALLSAVLLAVLDADRRVRELRAFVRKEIAAIDTTVARAAKAQKPVSEAPAEEKAAWTPTQEDVVGTVRALQAQYTGRLDRLQDAVEAALRQRDDRA